MAVRTGGLHTLAKAILQQKKISRLKREMCPSVGSQIAFPVVLSKLVSPCFFFSNDAFELWWSQKCVQFTSH